MKVAMILMTGGLTFWLLALPVPTLMAADAPKAAAKPAAKNAANEEEFLALIGSNLEARARALILRYITADSFDIRVNLTPSTKPRVFSEVPYLPRGLEAIPVAAMSAKQLANSVAKIELQIFLDARYKLQTKTKIEEMLRRNLGLEISRGDQITFAELGIEVSRPRSDIELALGKSEADYRDTKGKLETLSRERDDAKRDLSLAKSDLAKALAASGDKDKDKKPKSKEQLLADNLPIIVAAAVLLLLILASTFIVRGTLKTLSAGLNAIGAGIPALGEKIGEALSARSQSMDIAQISSQKAQASDASLPPAANGLAVPLEALNARILVLHHELLEASNERGDGLIIQHISQLLQNRQTISRAVVSMEILGAKKAGEIYHKLSLDNQLQVSAFLRTGHYERPKGELMLEAGEEMKTKLLAGSLGNARGNTNDQIAQRLIKLSPQDLCAISGQADISLLPRLFLHLEPTQLGAVLGLLWEENPTRFAEVAAVIPNMAETTAQTGQDKVDQQILQAIDQQLGRANEDAQRTYLDYYRTLIESVDEQAAEQLTSSLSTANPRIADYLRQNIISFATFPQLHADIQEEILDAISSKDMACLLAGLSEEAKAPLLARLNEQQLDLIKEEIERLVAKGPRQLKAAHSRAKQGVVSRIHALKGDRSLAELLARPGEQAPAAEGSATTPAQPDLKVAS